ncbi:hypothetical protein CQS04_00925 [Chryseomicrobium excrementi]|uniref:Uncharacterized protein n=1 Tax=Chryseomicrobium excrementi TaxID=2041346 RepID=A0A2M9F1Y1_9BACL|nr:hypothetical protein [Chryseomicrobium excrementi]PJK17478.1 hypothetical protein CQS04_00925 [Chryseomicrobium excrementi]
MIRSIQKDMGVYMIAIAQGALIGVVGFLLMGYLITYLDKTALVTEVSTVPVIAQEQTNATATEEKEKAYTYCTMQYGVFSTDVAAKNHLKQLELATAQLVTLNSYLFTWDGLTAAPEGLEKKPDTQPFTKEVIVKAKGCPATIELLAENLAKLDDQNFILSEAKARKFKSEEI